MPDSPAPVALVFGASRGIGRQIALSLAETGYVVVLSAKSTGLSTHATPDPNSRDSTIDSVLREVTQLGGRGCAIPCDVRYETQIQDVVTRVMSAYGRIDAMIYNPGAVWWSSVAQTPSKRYALMQSVNAHGLYVACQAVLPIFDAQRSGRIISVSPPIYSRFARGKTAYAMTKYAASVMTLGLAMDLMRRPDHASEGIAITSLWPSAAIQSAATKDAPVADLRHPKIFGDAVMEILKAPVGQVNGKLLLDDDFLLQECGYTDADILAYSVVPGSRPRRMLPAILPDLTVAEQEDEGDRRDSAATRAIPKL